MLKPLSINLCLLGLFASTLAIAAPGEIQSGNTSNINFTVKVRPQVWVNMRTKVIRNVNCHNEGHTLLAIHGLTHTAATFQNLANEIFGSNQLCSKVGRILLLDLPGHGGSGLPQSATVKYGDLNLDDYTTAVVESMKRYKSRGWGPRYIVGHSLGGLVVQMAQQKLITGGKNLRMEFGTRRVYLLASASPQQVPDYFSDSGQGAGALQAFTVQDPTKGAVARVDAQTWIGLFFVNFLGELVTGAPTPTEVEQKYYADESYAAAAQTFGVDQPRPSVIANVFSAIYNTVASVVSFEQDVFNLESDQEALYRHLSGDNSMQHYRRVLGDQSVHSMYLSNPAEMLSALNLD